jgi:hypothetical protein
MSMKRREFITLLGGAAAWPLAARGQQAAKLPIVGFLGTDASGWRPWTSAFVQRLHELGWIEGRTIAIEYRWSEGRPERHAEIAADTSPITPARRFPRCSRSISTTGTACRRRASPSTTGRTTTSTIPASTSSAVAISGSIPTAARSVPPA